MLFPDLPQRIARIFPTYYFLQPIYEIAVQGSTLGQHRVQVAVAVALCCALLPVVVARARRLEQQLATTS